MMKLLTLALIFVGAGAVAIPNGNPHGALDRRQCTESGPQGTVNVPCGEASVVAGEQAVGALGSGGSGSGSSGANNVNTAGSPQSQSFANPGGGFTNNNFGPGPHVNNNGR